MDSHNKFEEIAFTITDSLANIRLDKALLNHSRISSRSRAAQLVAEGLVRLNNKAVKPSKLTEKGEIYQIKIPIEKTFQLEPYNYDLEIVFEDDQLIVLNKPAGIVVHPSHGHNNKTLVNALVHHCQDLSMGFAENRPGIVHRLDKDTSGLLVVAKNDGAHTFLAKQFKEKTVNRSYYAICYGRPNEREGRQESHLIRHPIHRKKFCSENPEVKNKKGKWSATNWQVIGEYKNELSLILCRLETGRTHQIRIHLAEMGHPIVGDQIYGKANRQNSLKSIKLRREIKNLQRIGLVAVELGFIHPTHNMHMSFRCHWPKDLHTLTEMIGF